MNTQDLIAHLAKHPQREQNYCNGDKDELRREQPTNGVEPDSGDEEDE